MWLAFVAIEVTFIITVDLYVLVYVYGTSDTLYYTHTVYLQYALLALYIAVSVLLFTAHAVS
jgi:hypothetical protein